MFEPNLIGAIKKRVGRDVHGQAVLGREISCPFAIVNLEVMAQKTSVRADSSGSRGSADELTADRLRILISKFVSVAIDDVFIFEGASYVITSKHTRRSVMGDVDHYQCDLEILP
jgi:hypothetical protein